MYASIIFFLKNNYNLLKSLTFSGYWDILILWKCEQAFYMETHLTYTEKWNEVSGSWKDLISSVCVVPEVGKYQLCQVNIPSCSTSVMGITEPRRKRTMTSFSWGFCWVCFCDKNQTPEPRCISFLIFFLNKIRIHL